MTRTDEDAAWAQLAIERRAFADVLEGLSEEQWRTPSLCSSWTVAGVTTHMMVGQTGTLPQFLSAMLRARGRFARANELMVERKADRATSAIVADLRDHADDRFTPPGLDWHAPYADFLVHRLDALVPLGIEHGRTLAAWPDALDHVLGPKGRGGFMDRGYPSPTCVATDVEWSHGTGPRVEAPVEALALAITRRPTERLADLTGPGAATLAGWARRS